MTDDQLPKGDRCEHDTADGDTPQTEASKDDNCEGLNLASDAARRRDLLAAGLNPDHIVFARRTDDADDDPPMSDRRTPALVRLDDAEWAAILASGALPSEPSQAEAMDNRTFVEAVLSVVGRKYPWTLLDAHGLSSEAVRKKFARYAKKGVWQTLASRVETLTAQRNAELQVTARRGGRAAQYQESPSARSEKWRANSGHRAGPRIASNSARNATRSY